MHRFNLVIAAILALGAVGAIYCFFNTPYIPPSYEMQQLIQYREIGGNGIILFGYWILAIILGAAAMITVVASPD